MNAHDNGSTGISFYGKEDTRQAAYANGKLSSATVWHPETSPVLGSFSAAYSETWVIEAGDRVIQKKARVGFDRLTDWERLVYSLWVADYGMRNAGDLDTAKDVFPEFQSAASARPRVWPCL